MLVLVFGDIFGKPGRRALAQVVPRLRAKYQPDFIVGNVENLAGGRGVSRKSLDELKNMGFHGFTGGNHTWDNKEIYGLLESEPGLLRPANLPSPPGDPCPGKGYTLLTAGGRSLFLVNLMGRVFMDVIDCPFQAIDRILRENPSSHPILVDMHADATSEKCAMGWHLDGRVAAVVGTHSHVQTADERLLPGGTAFITDIGMTGSFDSAIGLAPAAIIKKFLTRRPQSTQVARENPGFCAVVIRIGADNRAESIERIRETVDIGEVADGERDSE